MTTSGSRKRRRPSTTSSSAWRAASISRTTPARGSRKRSTWRWARATWRRSRTRTTGAARRPDGPYRASRRERVGRQRESQQCSGGRGKRKPVRPPQFALEQGVALLKRHQGVVQLARALLQRGQRALHLAGQLLHRAGVLRGGILQFLDLLRDLFGALVASEHRFGHLDDVRQERGDHREPGCHRAELLEGY